MSGLFKEDKSKQRRISFRIRRDPNGYINAIDIIQSCKSTTGISKNIGDWLAQEETQLMLGYFQEISGIPPIFRQESSVGADEESKTMYLHPKIALRFAIFLDYRFGFWIEDLVNRRSEIQGNLFDEKDSVALESEHVIKVPFERTKASSHVQEDLMLKLIKMEKDISHIREWCDFIKEKESEQKKWFDLSFLNQALTTHPILIHNGFPLLHNWPILFPVKKRHSQIKRAILYVILLQLPSGAWDFFMWVQQVTR